MHRTFLDQEKLKLGQRTPQMQLGYLTSEEMDGELERHHLDSFLLLTLTSTQNTSRRVGRKCHIYLPYSCTYDHCRRQNARLNGHLA